MKRTITKSVNEMKNIKMFSIILIIASSVFLGCVQQQPPVATPTPAPIPTETIKPTAVPTTPAPTPTPELRNKSTYKVFVDESYGFRRVIETNYRPISYQNLTLNIYAGDTVIWVNDATTNEKLTIVSEQNLWSNTSSTLRWNYQSFNYTFTQPGAFGVYVKEYPRLKHQQIIVTQ